MTAAPLDPEALAAADEAPGTTAAPPPGTGSAPPRTGRPCSPKTGVPEALRSFRCAPSLGRGVLKSLGDSSATNGRYRG